MRLKIHHKLTLLFAAIIALILSGVFFYLNSRLKDHVLARTKEDLGKQTSLAKLTVRKELSAGVGLESIDKVAGEISQSLGLRVTIIDLSGVVLGDSELSGRDLEDVENHLSRPEVQEALSQGKGLSQRYSSTIGKDLLYYASVLEENDEEVIIRLSFPLLEVELITSELKRMLVFSFAAAFLLALGASFIVSSFITRPVKEIAWAAQNAARGNLGQTVSADSSDEIGDLARAFNFMLGQIKANIDEVASSESRLRAVLLSMFGGVMVTDKEGKIILVNDTLKEALDIKKNPEGKRSIEVVRNLQVQEVISQVLKEKREVISKEINVSGPQEKIFLLHGAAVLKSKICDGAVLVFQDITDLRKLENIRKDFVANVSHELRTPATSIKGYAETLLAGAWQDKESLEEFLKIINSDAQRLANLIDDILDLSKIESSQNAFSLEPVSLNNLIKEVTALSARKFDKKSLEVDLNLDKNLPKVLADKNQMRQVLINLIDNAIKYTDAAGKITITTQQQKNQVQIDVSDTGIGIPEEDLERVFERFYRVDKGRSRSLGGTGLGLSIVKNIILKHKGRIWCQSTEGKGSRFTITLPISS